MHRLKQNLVNVGFQTQFWVVTQSSVDFAFSRKKWAPVEFSFSFNFMFYTTSLITHPEDYHKYAPCYSLTRP